MPIRHFGAYISIHAPAWGATKTCSKAGQPAGISIHAPAWGATRTVLPDLVPGIISIHAPAWGATGLRLCCFRRRLIISIHAPAWGATMKCNGGIDFVSISIHAPAWGATSPGIAAPPVVFYFNPRTRVGCDAPINMGRIFFCLFQSTHPRGVRLSSYSLKSFRRNFNPRTRVGCDYFRENCYYPALISIHAPAWGATGRHTAACAGIAISIHAPAWGATLFVALFHIKAQFQSTHPRGVRQSIL